MCHVSCVMCHVCAMCHVSCHVLCVSAMSHINVVWNVDDMLFTTSYGLDHDHSTYSPLISQRSPRGSPASASGSPGTLSPPGITPRFTEEKKEEEQAVVVVVEDEGFGEIDEIEVGHRQCHILSCHEM